MLDIFNSDAFSVVSLTDAINKLKFVPGRIGQMGLFTTSSVPTTTVTIEEKNGVLVLVSPSPRGAAGQTVDKAKRVQRALIVPHFEINDAVMAESVQNVRPFGQETGLESVQNMVAEQMQVHSQSMAATEEYARVGAIKGVVTYADSTTLDLFSAFSVSQLAEVDFDLDNAAPASGALRKKCATVTRAVANALDGTPLPGLYAICGDAFFDDLIAHPEVRETYKNQSEARELRGGYVDGTSLSFSKPFEFGGIFWENYRGAVGGTTFVHTDKCHIAPMGVPGFFRSVYAPADYIETVNTLGKRLYAKQYAMPNGKGINLDVQMNVLTYCTRPGALQLGKRT
jgi:hypothetical protein